MELQQLQQQQLSAHSSTNIGHNNSTDDEPFWGKDGFTFADVLDVVNPLQHLPVVSKYYREQTGDDCCEGAQLVGGAVFGALLGGVSGVLTSIANAAVRHETEQDVSEHFIELVDDSLSFVDDSFNSVEDSFNSVEDSLNQEMAPERLLSNDTEKQKEEVNPFFAQAVNEGPDDYYPAQKAFQIRQGKDWGSV